jgi:hypothetical protein
VPRGTVQALGIYIRRLIRCSGKDKATWRIVLDHAVVFLEVRKMRNVIASTQLFFRVYMFITIQPHVSTLMPYF